MTVSRKQCESNIYHVIVRGVGRHILFEDERDNSYFLNLLKRFSREEQAALLAWCLMENHVHILLRCPLTSISRLMHNLNAAYAVYYNQTYDHVGHVFQGRFKSEPVDDDSYFLTVLRYIHQNPAKAGVASIGNYPWSSYGEYLYGAETCDTSLGLSLLGGVEAFCKFHRQDSGMLPCMSAEESLRKANEGTLRAIAIGIVGEDALSRLGSLPKRQRNQLLCQLKEAGLSVRQIVRLTGLGRSIVARAEM